jgi:hypothetical protein
MAGQPGVFVFRLLSVRRICGGDTFLAAKLLAKRRNG